MTRALIPMSADPVHYGHKALIEEAAQRYDRVCVAVTSDPRKSPVFSLRDRANMVRKLVRGLECSPTVDVGEWRGLAYDAALKYGADVIVRGARSGDEAQRERAQAAPYLAHFPELSFDFVHSPDDLVDVSSTRIKELASVHLPIEGMLPLWAKRALERTMLGHYRLGVTGRLAVGKSHAVELLRDALLASSSLSTLHLDPDRLQDELLAEDSPAADELRTRIAEIAGGGVKTDKDMIDRKALGHVLLAKSGAEKRQVVNELCAPHIRRFVRRKLMTACRGTAVIVESATLVEDNETGFVNGDVIVVRAPEVDHAAFIKARELASSRVAYVGGLQMPGREKLARANEFAYLEHCGSPVEWWNDKGARGLPRDIWGWLEGWLKGTSR
jgi:pantetheine-phosphate adenylyltransferase